MRQIFLSVAEGLLAIEKAGRVRRGWRLHRRNLGQVLKLELGTRQPLFVGLGLCEGTLDLLVLDDPALFEVYQQHLARLQTPLANDALVGNGQDADLRRHDDVVLVGNDEPGRAEAIPVKGGTDLAAVRKGHGGGTIPGLHERGMILVEGPALGIHERVARPGLRDEHHHRLGERYAACDQQLKGVVQAGRIGLAMRDQRPHLVEVRPQEVALQGASAGVHPVHIAPDGVDLAVVGDEPIGVGQLPGGEGVGRESLVDEGKGRDRARIAQVAVETTDLVGQEQAFVDHGTRREGRQVELRQVGEVLLHRQLGKRVLELLADRQQLTLEGVLVANIRTHADDGLADDRHLGEDRGPEARNVGGHVAPTQKDLALDLQEVLELLDGDVARLLVQGQETHGHRIMASLGKVDRGRVRPVTQQGIGNLDQNPGAVSHEGIGTHGTPVVQVDENLQTAGHDFVRFAPLDVGDKTHPARVMLVARIVQTLLLWSPHGDPHSHRIKAQSNAAAGAVFVRTTASPYRL